MKKDLKIRHLKPLCVPTMKKKKCLEFILLVLINMTYIFGFPRRNDCEDDSGHTH